MENETISAASAYTLKSRRGGDDGWQSKREARRKKIAGGFLM
ncbi:MULTISPECIES: hypothetical protein [Planococcus]|jgi:hypothetical protein|nr:MULTISPECIES: hypothetical protein [Planococcus]